ncbi:MAG: hypothetical protein ABR520_02830, partial [Mycobacteriales bacterium]
DDSLPNTMAEFTTQGLNRNDRKYLVWMDSTVLCGIAGYYNDDRKTETNANNGTLPGSVARVDSGCWGLAGQGQSVEAHELMHTMGAVMETAPHATTLGHCTDDADRMCYEDGSPQTVVPNVCPPSNESLFDCRHDDYYDTAPSSEEYLGTHWNAADSSFLATTAPTAMTAPPPATTEPAATTVVTVPALSRFSAVPPARLVDTRTGNGGRTGKLGPGQAFAFPVTGRGGVPASDVSAVVLNVTVTGPTAPSNLTVYADGTTRPLASNLSFGATQTIANLVIVPVGSNGRIAVFNSAGSTHVVADVTGWYDDGLMSATALFVPLPPVRLLDTRNGIGGRGSRLGAAEAFALQVAGRGGVPSTGAVAAALNVTATGASAASYLTVYPTGTTRPTASTVNFLAGKTVPNLAIVPLGTGGRVYVLNGAGAAHAVVDVVGYYVDASVVDLAAVTAARFTALPPARLLDTRDGTGGLSGKLGAGQSVDVQATGRGGIPLLGASAVVVNVTVTGPTAASYVTVYPSGLLRPNASNLNFAAGQTVSNLVVVPLGDNGRITFFNPNGSTHVIADVVGRYDELPAV